MNINNQKIEHFCTLFDHKFLPMGMSLHQSLMNHAQPFHLWVICMDDLVEEQLKILSLPQVTLIPLKEIETPELLSVKSERNRGEYCWTITPFTFTAVFERQPEIERVTYLDADLFFFRNPQILLQEFTESDRDILITEHSYAPEYDQTLLSGRFCVQFLTAKNNCHGFEIILWWQKKSLEWCFSRVEDGKFGDQKYLDVWILLFADKIWISQQKENILAPWNIAYFGRHLKDKLNPVFYHFHSLRIINKNEILLYIDYKIGKFGIKCYNQYVEVLTKQIKQLNQKEIQVHSVKISEIISKWNLGVYARFIKYFLYIVQQKISFKKM